MESAKQKKLFIVIAIIFLALALPLALAAAGGWKMWREYKEQSELKVEYNDALKASIERAAETVMPVPNLYDEPIEMSVPSEHFESELQRVVRLVKGLGGSSSAWNDGETVRIVANIPESADQLFREALSRGVRDIVSAGETKPLTVVQIVLKPEEKNAR